ncbi:MAG: hypothetical protein PF484_07635 [Bacteroidales bacterium]|jgi:hypothetical protein|nr:hypothetical protein [Bacteroidales bacterium]
MENKMTIEESFKIIQKSIANSRKNMREASFYYLLWGWTLILASLTNYFVLRYYIQAEAYAGTWWKSLLAWTIFLVSAAIILRIKNSRSTKREKVVTHIDRFISILWLGSGIIMGLMVFLSFKVNSYPTPFILAITALATFVSGAIVRYKPLIFGSIIFLAASIISIYVSGLEQLLVFAAAVALGYLFPGYLLKVIKTDEDV